MGSGEEVRKRKEEERALQMEFVTGNEITASRVSVHRDRRERLRLRR